MKKKIIYCLLLIGLLGCTPSVTIKEKTSYKCGDKIITVEFLDDNSIIIQNNGIATVLNQTPADSGTRYDNPASQMTFTQQSGNIYFTLNGMTYPLCLEIKQ